MKRLAYVSNNKIYVYDAEKDDVTEIPCGRIEQYRNTVAELRKKNEWKTTGKGAQFMGMAQTYPDENSIFAEIGGIAVSGDTLIYGVRLDETGSIYKRSLDPKDMSEGLIISGKEISPERMDCMGDKLAVSMGSGVSGTHISVYSLDGSEVNELTDGDSLEQYPRYDNSGNIYYSSAGLARDETGCIAAVQNKSISKLDMKALSIDELLSDERYDYISPVPDNKGGFWCIRRKKRGSEDSGNILADIVLLPYRLVKALIGFLNTFSMIFGGEALKSGGNAKAKQRDEKQAFIDGNLINAEKNMKEAERRGEKHPGIMPADSVLLHVDTDGKQETVRTGVLDYLVFSDGGYAFSNGRYIILADKDMKETSAVRADRALSLKEIR